MEMITPDQVQEKRKTNLDPKAVKVISEMIQEAFLKKGVESTWIKIDITDYANRLVSETGLTRSELYGNQSRWMDVELDLQKAGWIVEYVRPPYYDSTPQHWIIKMPSA